MNIGSGSGVWPAVDELPEAEHPLVLLHLEFLSRAYRPASGSVLRPFTIIRSPTAR